MNNQEKHRILAILLVFVVVAVAGCSTLSRSSQHEPPESSRGGEREWAERDDAAGELGLAHSGEMTSAQRATVEARMELTRLERTELEGRHDREQYYRAKPMLSSDAERIEMLRIGSDKGRERWLRSKNLLSGAAKFAPDVQELIRQNDVAVGMTKQAVRESWGEPESVDVAGNPVYGNERWKYKEQIASSEGYQTEGRLLFFESGRVVGWEKY